MFGNKRKTISQTPSSSRQMTRTPTRTRSGITETGSLSMGNQRLSTFSRPGAVAARDVKSLIGRNAAKVHSFLKKHEEDDAPSDETIRDPKSSKVFASIFELIYQHLSKDYEVPPGRLEDELIPMFRGLGYPFPLKGSYFQPIGSSHGYANLVDALAWLVDLVTISNEVAGVTQNILIGDFTEQNRGKGKLFKYSFMVSSYKDYTTNRQSLRSTGFAKEKSEKFREFMQREDDVEEQYEESKAVLDQLNYECEELEADKGREQQLKFDQAQLKEDVRMACEYNEKVAEVLKSCQKEYETHISELQEKTSEVNRLSKNVEVLKMNIEEQKKNHGLSGEAVRKMNNEMKNDIDTLREKSEQNAELGKELWLAGQKDQETFKEQLMNFTQLMRIVSGLSSGLNVGLEDYKEPRNEDDLQEQLDCISRKWAPSIAQELNRKKLEVETQMSRIQQKTEALTERIQMINEQLDELKRKEAREDRIRRKEKDEWKEERLQWEESVERLENELEVVKERLQESGSLEKQIANEKEAYEKLKLQIEERTLKMHQVMKEKIDMIIDETTALDSKYMKMMKDCDELSETVQKLKL